MAESAGRAPKESTSSDHPRRKKKCKDLTDSEFENMTNRNLPNWNAVWNLLLQESKEKRKEKKEAKIKSRTSSISSPSSSPSSRKENPTELQRKIQKKITELVNDEEALVHLYLKAAENAKERQDEMKEKMATLVEQIQRDRYLMKLIRDLS